MWGGGDDRTSEQRRSTSWPHRQDSFDSFSVCEIKDLQQHCRAIRSPLLRLRSFVHYSCLRFVAFIRHKEFPLISLIWYLLQQNIYTASYFCQIWEVVKLSGDIYSRVIYSAFEKAARLVLICRVTHFFTVDHQCAQENITDSWSIVLLLLANAKGNIREERDNMGFGLSWAVAHQVIKQSQFLNLCTSNGTPGTSRKSSPVCACVIPGGRGLTRMGVVPRGAWLCGRGQSEARKWSKNATFIRKYWQNIRSEFMKKTVYNKLWISYSQLMLESVPEIKSIFLLSSVTLLLCYISSLAGGDNMDPVLWWTKLFHLPLGSVNNQSLITYWERSFTAEKCNFIVPITWQQHISYLLMCHHPSEDWLDSSLKIWVCQDKNMFLSDRIKLRPASGDVSLAFPPQLVMLDWWQKWCVQPLNQRSEGRMSP